MTTSGTAGFGSLARVKAAMPLAKVTGTYQATYYDNDCDDIWGGTLTFDAAGNLTAGVYSGVIPFESGSIALSPKGPGALRDLYEGILSAGPEGKIHFAGYLAADSGIISGWYEDLDTRNGTFLFDPIGEGLFDPIGAGTP